MGIGAIYIGGWTAAALLSVAVYFGWYVPSVKRKAALRKHAADDAEHAEMIDRTQKQPEILDQKAPQFHRPFAQLVAYEKLWYPAEFRYDSVKIYKVFNELYAKYRFSNNGAFPPLECLVIDNFRGRYCDNENCDIVLYPQDGEPWVYKGLNGFWIDSEKDIDAWLAKIDHEYKAKNGLLSAPKPEGYA